MSKNVNPCDGCIATIGEHESLMCAADRLHNSFEVLKKELCNATGYKYRQKFQCQCKEIKQEKEGYNMNEYKKKMLTQIEIDIAEGKLKHVAGALLIRYILQIEDDE